jgi:hypothetical protein
MSYIPVATVDGIIIIVAVAVAVAVAVDPNAEPARA